MWFVTICLIIRRQSRIGLCHTSWLLDLRQLGLIRQEYQHAKIEQNWRFLQPTNYSKFEIIVCMKILDVLGKLGTCTASVKRELAMEHSWRNTPIDGLEQVFSLRKVDKKMSIRNVFLSCSSFIIMSFIDVYFKKTRYLNWY